MYTSRLARTAVAGAALAIGSVALAAVPATAATPTGITQDQVLTVASTLRMDDPTEAQEIAAQKALRVVMNRSCAIDSDAGEYLGDNFAEPTQANATADGFIGGARVDNVVTETSRYCFVGAVASTVPGFTLQGTAALDVPTQPVSSSNVSAAAVSTSALSGDVFVTPPVSVGQGFNISAAPSFSAAGASTKTTTTTTEVKVADRKTKSEKKAAKSKYTKRLAAAKKNYAKALDKAGSSKNKKAAAKRIYVKARALAKAKYKIAIANYKLVKKSNSTTDTRPFTIGATLNEG
ncbi:hypothetical protein [Aeromicrobium fastidiosum]|uniref:Uncharacterized protein n=1 Tax=Aeromicrobium fastidiosum TaxID=52699 RepID=A0A641ATR5_9ACTN|nr:hypothetical protein [Aeromicrobium fastidiosum]KAA1380431.1 hypothetical protein ESP62_004415 [Aeromicrobium fastidiosum]MBP2390009.1 hypothetical protein [Aeromicrobium fastidiosum]